MQKAALTGRSIVVKELKSQLDPKLRAEGIDTAPLWEELAQRSIQKPKGWIETLLTEPE